MANKIKLFRLSKNLTQKKLAELIGTSQQQIQRIEKGDVATRLDMAAKLCQVLEQPVEKLFPGATKALNKMQNERETSQFVELESWAKVRGAGIEPDHRVWTIKMGIRGYADPFVFLSVPALDKERIFSQIQLEDSSSDQQMAFVVFDSATDRIAVNLSELSYCHFLFDLVERQIIKFDECDKNDEVLAEDQDDAKYLAQAYMVGGGDPLVLDLDADESEFDESEEMSQCNGIFYDLENFCEKSHRILLEDVNGENVFIRAGNLAILMVSINVLIPPSIEGPHEYQD
jgi:transcriptional regulator with XRE-family HTH domain